MTLHKKRLKPKPSRAKLSRKLLLEWKRRKRKEIKVR